MNIIERIERDRKCVFIAAIPNEEDLEYFLFVNNINKKSIHIIDYTSPEGETIKAIVKNHGVSHRGFKTEQMQIDILNSSIS